MVLVAVVGLVAIAVGRGLFNFLQGYLAERASQGVAFDLRDALFARIQRLSFSYYDQAQTGQLLTRLTNDVEQVRTFVGSRRHPARRVADDAHRLRGAALPHQPRARRRGARRPSCPSSTCSRSSSRASGRCSARCRWRSAGSTACCRRICRGCAWCAPSPARRARRRATSEINRELRDLNLGVITRHQQQLPVREPVRQPRHHRRRRRSAACRCSATT